MIAIVAPLVLPGYFEVNIALILLALTLSLRLRGAWRVLFTVFTVTAFFSIRGAHEYLRDVRVMERDFYGVVFARVTATIRHRIARCFMAESCTAVSCWAMTFAIDPAITLGRHRATVDCSSALNKLQPQPRRVGIVGQAPEYCSYGRQGDEFTFYEISPRVIAIADDEFTFLRDSPAKIDVVLGDGRLSLERRPPGL